MNEYEYEIVNTNTLAVTIEAESVSAANAMVTEYMSFDADFCSMDWDASVVRINGELIGSATEPSQSVDTDNASGYCIKRVINGILYKIPLSCDELASASKEHTKNYFLQEITGAASWKSQSDIDNCVSIAWNAWENGEYESQYECIVYALDDSIGNGIIDEYVY